MGQYYISFEHPHRHFVDIDFTVESRGEESLRFQLPAWRPGRYELGNFAKNVQKWAAFNEKGEQLKHEKVSKDCWEVETNGASQVTIAYNYYANQLDAGSTYLDEQQLYVNPVNCCLYVEGRIEEPCRISLELPADYEVACGLKKESDHVLLADSFDQLAESPWIASNSLQHDVYHVNDIPFHLWFQGPCQPDFERLKKDFKAFTEEQMACFGGFPVEDYHFLFQVTPYKAYHGVEHTNSTVILLGSEGDIFEDRYEALLGISSHELYHTWNIKAIRPIEMLPYDYTKENYSKLGYVAEGVTTYMGDVMLHRPRVFDWEDFVKTQNENLKRHYENEGRHNLSVADSSVDTWLDGYELGIPNRKTSIYAEGALNMLMIDLLIIKNTEGKKSLNDVMHQLYQDFALKGKAYTEEDFQSLCVNLGGLAVAQIFAKHIYGVEDYTKSLEEVLSIVGVELVETENPSISARSLGLMTVKNGKSAVVKKMQFGAAADLAGIAVEDEILAVNGKSLEGKLLNDLLEKAEGEVTLQVKRRFETKDVSLKMDNNHYPLFRMDLAKDPSTEQMLYRKVWVK
jgi:predicted metalloprotease with PDZ domain